MEKYIVHNSDAKNDGCGVIVKDYFITAAHMVTKYPFYLYYNGKSYQFEKKDALVFIFDQQESGGDIAAFKIDFVDSPLELSDTLPNIGDIYTSLSFNHVVSSQINDNIFSSQIIESNELLHCDAVVEEIYSNFFSTRTSKILREGSSGSPIIKDNKVYGILHGGKPGENYCLFQSSKSILELLKRLNN